MKLLEGGLAQIHSNRLTAEGTAESLKTRYIFFSDDSQSQDHPKPGFMSRFVLPPDLPVCFVVFFLTLA